MPSGGEAQLFTVETLSSFRGLSLAAYLVTSVLGLYLKRGLVTAALLVSVGLSLIASAMRGATGWQDLVLAVLDGLLIFFVALGGNKLVGQKFGAKEEGLDATGASVTYQGPDSFRTAKPSLLRRLLREW